MLVRIAVHGVIQEIRANAAVIQQRVPFAGRAVAGDRLARALGFDQKFQQRALRLLHLLGKCAVGFMPVIPAAFFARAQSFTRAPAGFDPSSAWQP